MTTIFTVGHSNHPIEHLMALLQQHNIRLVADVRSSPYSRYVPQANREPLSSSLTSSNIAYRWFGDRLGGKPDGEVAVYDQMRASLAFRQGIDDLLAVAVRTRTAILCSEGDHRQCHRHKLITPALLDREVQVLHIQPDGMLIDENDEPRQLVLF